MNEGLKGNCKYFLIFGIFLFKIAEGYLIFSGYKLMFFSPERLLFYLVYFDLAFVHLPIALFLCITL